MEMRELPLLHIAWKKRILEWEIVAGQALSIAYGSSYLLDKNGNKQSVSSWREEADQKMYLDKKRKKQTGGKHILWKCRMKN